MKTYVTHILADTLPESGYKQISFLTSNPQDYLKRIFYFGYGGSVELTEHELSQEIEEGKIIRLADPKIVNTEKYFWLDSKGDIFMSEDYDSEKEMVENSGLLPFDSSKDIFERTISKRIEKMHIHKCVSIP